MCQTANGKPPAAASAQHIQAASEEPQRSLRGAQIKQTNKLGFSVQKFLIFLDKILNIRPLCTLCAERRVGSLQQPQLNTAASKEPQPLCAALFVGRRHHSALQDTSRKITGKILFSFFQPRFDEIFELSVVGQWLKSRNLLITVKFDGFLPTVASLGALVA